MTLPSILAFESLHAGYRDGTLTPEQVFTEVLARVDAYADPAVWIARVPPQTVLAQARALPREASLRAHLPLYGLPFAVKDNIDVAGLPTTAACPEFSYLPGETAFAVRRLLAAGAILIGKTNLDQFATGLVGTRSPYGAPRCVYNADYISGGSSSGSAIAVAAGLCSFALGTDTAGSGRVPAAFNNIVGIKPTRGLVSASGVVPACRSLDCVSVFAAGVADARAVISIARGFDADDPYAREERDASIATRSVRYGVLAAIEREFFGDDEAAELYAQAVERVKASGGEIVEFDFAPFLETAQLLYGGPWVAERMAAIEPFYASRADAIEPTVRAIVGGASRYSAVDAFKAQYRLRAIERRCRAQWTRFDVMLLPTTPTTYTVAEVSADPIGTNSRLGTYTNFVNLLDYCAIAVPAGFRRSGLPFGVSFIGPAFTDNALAEIAIWFGADLNAVPQRGGAVPRDGEVALAVAGAHLSGFPLNDDLLVLGAALVGTFVTDPSYRLYALAHGAPPKPGLARDPGFAGPGIEVEVWSLTSAAFGAFVAALPQPMGIGRITLSDGTDVAGFVCERYALDGAREITSYGGWRAYCAQHVEG